MLSLYQPQSQVYRQTKDLLGGSYITPHHYKLAPALPALPCPPATKSGMEVLPTLGTGPYPRPLGVGRQGAALNSTLGGGPRVPAWAEGQLSTEIAEPGTPLS